VRLQLSRENLALGATALATAGAVAFLPHEWWPKCPIYALTGLYCPGCGGLRATWDLLHGNVSGAINQNALIFAIPVLVALGFWAQKRGSNRTKALVMWSAIFVAAAFTIARNLPGSWMAPDPFGI